MNNTLFIKNLRDLWLYRSRAILVVLAVAVGTAAVGVATTSFLVIRGDLRDGYRRANPAHATLDIAALGPVSLDGTLAERLAELPEVAAVEPRRTAAAQMSLDGGETRLLEMMTLPAAPTIGVLNPQDGAAVPPPDDAIALERSAALVLGIEVGDVVTVDLLEGDTFRLPVAGFVHDLTVLPTTVQPGVTGYISEATAANLGLPAGYNQLRLSVSAAGPDRAAVETAVTAATEWLEGEGVLVSRAAIPEPGVHLMQGSADTGLLMISILGGLTLVLSAFLVTNIMSAVIAEQVPIIGVMKALGAGRGLILRQYGLRVLAFGLVALALAVPLGLFGAWFQSTYLAGQLNFDIVSFRLPWQTALIQIGGALLVPALAAWGPLRTASRQTIREAFGGQGIGGLTRSSMLARLEGLPRTAALALRNVARRKVRLVLTLVALSLAGAMFIAAFGVRLALYDVVEVIISEFSTDVQIDFAQPYPLADIEREAAALAAERADIERIEVWGVADARRVYPDGRVGSSFPVYGVPPTTDISANANRDGRWLAPGDENAVYISYETEKLTLQPRVGETLSLRFNGLFDDDMQLVGISQRPFEPAAYVPYAAFEQATGRAGQGGRLVVYMSGDDPAQQQAVAGDLLARYRAAGLNTVRVETAGSQRDNLKSQFDILIVLLMALAGLTALVGGMGLANTMALNVLERSREIGILRSMGAGRPLLRRLVLAEGLAVALISAFFGTLLALPLTIILGRVMGDSLIGSPLSFAFSSAAALGWLALVLLIGLLACWLPAENAARMTIRAALAYE